MHTYRVTFYGRHNIRLHVEDVEAMDFAAALHLVNAPLGAVRVWVGLVPANMPGRPQYRPSDGPQSPTPQP
jgi:hypothetical protein